MDSARGPSAERTPDIESLSYEAARAELVAVVQALEAGSNTLEESLQAWERGEALADRCQQWLDSARARLEQLTAGRETDRKTGADDAAEPEGGNP
ncbi:MAG: exodeoxyribonuclease VII small subunit [Bifidobacteriaceae bacterium]|jgi:exodeoxyribonuclease VII small subunit|nr:exodeoxyribonuclease VII small subunit [Bifidobacteriaceae bacterium]